MLGKKRKLISLVLPCYNEAESLPLLVERLAPVLRSLNKRFRFEVLIVNDGSTDRTVVVSPKLSRKLPHTLISLSRNFGHQAALYAGLHRAKGDAVITLDADLQHPPELIPQLLKAFTKGADIVQTQRTTDSELPWLKQLTSRTFYKILNFISPTPVTASASDYRLLSRSAVDTIVALPEKRVFLRGLVHWVGFKMVTVPFQAEDRVAGTSKYTWWKMIRLALNGITAFSTAPLYLAAFIAALFSILTVVYALYVVYIWLWSDAVVQGWSSVVLVLLGMGSIISFLFAVTGLYLAALFEEVKQRPIYIIKDVRNHR